MQVETKQAEAQPTNAQGVIECPNCHAVLPEGMLFCRMCGTRLIEGNFTEATTRNLGNRATLAAMPAAYLQAKRRRGPHWIVWMILGIVIASFIGGALLRPVSRVIDRGRSNAASRNLQSRVGVDDFTTIQNNGGAMINYVTPPDSPFDKAGIVGGDIIKGFDGKQIRNEDDIRSAINSTPVGKTVEVIYTRDGETKKTSVTTVNEEEIGRLEDIYDDKPKGRLGIDDTERVPVPNTNIYGVRIGDISKNSAAFFADMKEGDIVTEFNGIPIRTEEELNSRIYRATPRSTVKVVIMRDGQKVELNVKMGER
jgi:S1-C subfamily serine protease